jgi:hypothetical protein
MADVIKLMVTLGFVFAVYFVAVAVAIRLSCLIIDHKIKWKIVFITAIATGLAGMIPSCIGLLASAIVLCICLKFLGEMDLWPEAVFIAVITPITVDAILYATRDIVAAIV